MSAIEVYPYDGWIRCGETLTYASATTFTVVGDQTAKYSKGTRLKLTQTTIKYFVVVGSSYASGTTTVTITGGSDYTFANATVNDPYFSYAANPRGYPVWFNYTPTYGGFTGTPTTYIAKFSILGSECHLILYFSGTSNATSMTATAPVTAASDTVLCPCYVQDNGVGVTTPGRAVTTASSATLTFGKDMSGAAFTGSNAKGADLQMVINF